MVTWQPGMTLSYLEKLAIKASMRFHQNNKTATANSLGICVRTLDNKLASYVDEDKKEQDGNAKDRTDREKELDRHRYGANAGNENRDAINVPQYPGGPTEGRTVGDGEQQPVAGQQTSQPIGQPPNGNGSGGGAPSEPSPNVAAQHSMPMPQRKEVQDMPSKQVAPIRQQSKR